MNQTVLITGASFGIGLDFVHLFAKRGFDLVITARSEDRLNKIAKKVEEKYGICVISIPLDLSQHNSPQQLFSLVQNKKIQIDILVNNAGFGMCEPFEQSDAKRNESMIFLNITALTTLTRLFLDGMIERGNGRILNVASVAGFQPGPFMAVYYATKAYVISFSDALVEELRGTGVTVTTLCPGPTITEFQERSGMDTSMLFKGPFTMKSMPVARAALRGMDQGKAIVIPGFMNKVFAQGYRFFPRAIIRRIVYYVQKKLGRDKTE